jgi:hypothetical protein
MAEPVANLYQKGNPLRHREGASASLMLAERFTLEVRHNQIQQSVRGLAQPQDGTNIRMVQAGGDGGLAPEALDRSRVARKPRYQDLHGDRASGAYLRCLVDIRHPTFAQFARDLVSLVEDLAGEGREPGAQLLLQSTFSLPLQRGEILG